MKKLNQEEIDRYTEWVLTECCSPVAELEYLISMVLKSEYKETLIEDIKLLAQEIESRQR